MAADRQMNPGISVIIAARNEADGLRGLLPELRRVLDDAGYDWELLVVDDGSTDDTAQIAGAEGARVVPHPYPMGNGAAIKSGARVAAGSIIVTMDADGQHRPADVPALVAKLDNGYDMAVGARGLDSQAHLARGFGNWLYNRLATYMVNQTVADLSSGFRAVKAAGFREFLHLFPNGFSYPTTVTMAFFRAGYAVAYHPITANKRKGKSHLRPLRDGVRFLLIIFRVATLYSPLKLFVPVSAAFFLLGLGRYVYTYITEHQFTNMSALLFVTAVTVFLIGLVSEQITALIYKDG